MNLLSKARMLRLIHTIIQVNMQLWIGGIYTPRTILAGRHNGGPLDPQSTCNSYNYELGEADLTCRIVRAITDVPKHQ